MACMLSGSEAQPKCTMAAQWMGWGVRGCRTREKQLLLRLISIAVTTKEPACPRTILVWLVDVNHNTRASLAARPWQIEAFDSCMLPLDSIYNIWIAHGCLFAFTLQTIPPQEFMARKQ